MTTTKLNPNTNAIADSETTAAIEPSTKEDSNSLTAVIDAPPELSLSRDDESPVINAEPETATVPAAQAIRRIIKVKQVNSPPPAPAPVPATDAKSTYTCGVKALDELLTKIEPVDWSKHTKTGSDGKVSPPNQKVYKLRAIDAVKAAARVAGTAFCNYADNTTIYNGKCYVDIDCKALPQFLKYAAYQADVPADIARDEPFLDKLVKQFYLDSGENIVAAPPESYINLNNGTMIFNQNGRSFEPHSPHRFIRYALDFDYEPDAKCDRWQEHLDRCLPDKEQQRYLSKLLALPFYQRKVETLGRVDTNLDRFFRKDYYPL